ncbi:kinase-like protein [Polyplosphaeria fusca]|uniref:ethanolamine kinase n=1 Tax=Polyplosphaeria fusca TaxID=682080 RepID=A0A9P4R1Y8_9PLEO|nr:kinase-like protein [Polyplosphaeria fusca]
MSSPFESVRYLPLLYDPKDSQNSALNLILTLRPEWRESKSTVEFVHFTDGITNTLLKAINRLPDLSEAEIDRDAVLLRAYGKGTDVLIDREKESLSHCLLARHNLAPPLFARFDNGLLYKYIPGSVCAPSDLRRAEVWRGVARRLGEWHARLPISSISSTVDDVSSRIATSPMHTKSSLASSESASEANSTTTASTSTSSKRASSTYSSLTQPPGTPTPNLWSVMHKWIRALPQGTTAERARHDLLARELAYLVSRLGASHAPYVFAHCDLLSGNVIIAPSPPSASASRRSSRSQSSSSLSHEGGEGGEDGGGVANVAFIDYEYTTAAPAAFDLANHFAEWGGFECDYAALPTRGTRRAFLREYLASYALHHASAKHEGEGDGEEELDRLCEEVDEWRGVPGFYWGIWAAIQAGISQIEFDYRGYGEVRLGEYWGWKRAGEGGKGERGEREARWGME